MNNIRNDYVTVKSTDELEEKTCINFWDKSIIECVQLLCSDKEVTVKNCMSKIYKEQNALDRQSNLTRQALRGWNTPPRSKCPYAQQAVYII